jgi:glycosyltransferase involved in cell wall biosynthesis
MLKTVWSRRNDYSVALVDVFSGLAFSWAETVAWSLRRLGKPYVMTLHGGGLPEFAARWPQRVRTLLHSAIAVTSPSGYLKHHMASYCSNIRLVPNPIHIGRYPHRPRSVLEPRLIWLRAFHETYNPVMAINTLARLDSVRPEVLLTMVGPDKGDRSLQRTVSAAASAGVASRVKFVGLLPKNEVPGILDQANIFLNTTTIDNTPVSVLEAMACGLCVVSTDVGGLPFLLENGRDALLVSSGDSNAMAAAVDRLMKEADLAERLSVSARRHAEQFDWSLILPRWEMLFHEAVGKHTSRRLEEAAAR